MIVKLADHIVTPLAEGTGENYRRVKRGESMLRRYDGWQGVPEPFTASLFAANELCGNDRFTRFEQLCIRSIDGALDQLALDPAHNRVLFIFSTTKGNVELLNPAEGTRYARERVLLGESARVIARHYGNYVMPVVVSNACTSGVCALIAGMRALQSGRCDYAIVTGCDVQSPFIVSGFQSFKALDPDVCRPFDATRAGLNLGEAAATMVLSRAERSQGRWTVVRGAIRNDANHISGPSRTGEGSYRALRAALGDFPAERLAVVNVHGTATSYNDEMESIALARAGVSAVPVNSLKGYFGHTMGAAGVLESAITMSAIDDATVLATRGYNTSGVSCEVSVDAANRPTDRTAFVKLLSGFGGCNAALLFQKGGDA